MSISSICTLYSEGPFEVPSYEHFGLEWPFNIAAMIFIILCQKFHTMSHLKRGDLKILFSQEALAINRLGTEKIKLDC